MEKYKIVVAHDSDNFFNEALSEISSGPEHFKNLNLLLQHLSNGSPKMTLASFEKFFKAGGIIVIATHNNEIIGMATLVTVTKLNGVTGRIEHVVVDPVHQGNGLSRKLMDELIKIARSKKLRYLDLTTEPKRIAANGLYQSLGFIKRETNPYRLIL